MSVAALLALGGMSYYREDAVEKAAQAFRSAVELDSESVGAWWMLGQCYRDLGDGHQARECFRRAAGLACDVPSLSRAHALLLLGNFAEGWPEHERAKGLNRVGDPRCWDGSPMEAGVAGWSAG